MRVTGDYVLRRGQRWFAVMEIPKELRVYFPSEKQPGKFKARFNQPLPRSITTRGAAIRAARVLVVAWEAQITTARAGHRGNLDPTLPSSPNGRRIWRNLSLEQRGAIRGYLDAELPPAGDRSALPDLSEDELEAVRRYLAGEWSAPPQPPAPDPAALRQLLREAQTPQERNELIEYIADRADEIGAAHVDLGQSPTSSPEAQEFVAEAMGWRIGTLDHLEEWTGSLRTVEKTKDMFASDVRRFAAKFPMLSSVDRPSVRRWTIELMNGSDGLSPKTVSRILTAVRGYWGFLQTMNVVAEDRMPFEKLGIAKEAKRQGKDPRTKRKPFESADVVKLLRAAMAKPDGQLADLIRIGAFSGARLEEVCALRVEDAHADWFRIGDAKSAAGVRDVPIHSALQPTIKRLVRNSTDGYVISGLTFNKYGDRSNAIGKRFGRLRTEEGYGSGLVFHSFRKAVVTLLEGAGISENFTADIIGHEKPRITYGLYSGGASMTAKREALEKLTYPDWPDDEAVAVKPVQRRRIGRADRGKT